MEKKKKKCTIKLKANGKEGTISLTDNHDMLNFICPLSLCLQGQSIYNVRIGIVQTLKCKIFLGDHASRAPWQSPI